MVAATSLEGTLAFCRMAIRSGAIFNGGALVALIPVTANAYFRIVELSPPERIIHTKVIDGLVSAATVFVIGLVISGLSSIIAFFGEFYYTNFHLTNNSAFKGKSQVIFFAGAAAVLLSLILFAIGSYTAIHSFQNASGL